MSAAVLASESDPRAAARALAQEAESSALDRPGPALALAERSAELARQCGDLPILGWALMLVGRVQGCLGHHLQAFEAANEAYALLSDCGDPAHRLWALNICSLMVWAGGDADRAIELLRNGLAATAGRLDLSASRSAMLLNMSVMLQQEAGEYAEAIRCCADALALGTPSPQQSDRGIQATAHLAYLHIKHAEHLADQGFPDEAGVQREAAAKALPLMDFRSWRTFSFHEHMALNCQVIVLAGLARWPMARQAAAVALWSLREPGGGLLARSNRLEALAIFYRCAGRRHRAIHFELQLLIVLRAAKNNPEIGRCLQRLADLHAQTGDYALALDFCKQLATLQNRQRLEAGELRGRLAVIEREATRRRDQAHEERAHTQRLAVIGRLIAQTHHALSVPAEQAHRLTAQALERLRRPESASLVPMLQELNETVDRAAGLVSQLKLFSYRSVPQPMALSLRDALLSAYQSLAPHIGLSARRLPEIEVRADTPEQAWADTQRLGIMLRVLLIELAQWAGSAGRGAAIRARIASDKPAAVSLHIEARGSADPRAAAQALATLGGTLCMEIANEMGGALEAACDESGVLTYGLCLPGAGMHLPRLLQTLP
jgi:tetratricopeptide (TPR) repeat protein